MKNIQPVSLIGNLITFYRHFWSVYQLEERSQPVVVNSVSTAEPRRSPLSVIVCQQTMIDIFKVANGS